MKLGTCIIRLKNGVIIDVSDLTVEDAIAKLRQSTVSMEDIEATIHYLKTKIEELNRQLNKQ